MRRPSSKEKGDGRTFSKGPWTADEDRTLIEYMAGNNGRHRNWQRVPMLAGIDRCGKSCRLRWSNYLRPGINRSPFTNEEDMIIVNLHSIMGNRWAAIARALPGRTDNDIKNHWNTYLGKKLLAMGIDPRTHSLLPNDLRPDFIRLQADLTNFFAKLNSRVTSHSALHPLWPNNAAITTPLQEGAFQDEYVIDDGKVDLQQLATISPPCSDVLDPNILATTNRDIKMAIAEPDVGNTGNWWTVPSPPNEPPANLAASRLSRKCCRSMSSRDAVITESTVPSQFGKNNKAGHGDLEDDNDEFWNKLLNY